MWVVFVGLGGGGALDTGGGVSMQFSFYCNHSLGEERDGSKGESEVVGLPERMPPPG